MTSITRFSSQTPALVQFGGNDKKGNELVLRRKPTTVDDLLMPVQDTWQQTTPLQRNGVKGAVGVALLAYAANKKAPGLLRGLALVAGAGLLLYVAGDVLGSKQPKGLPVVEPIPMPAVGEQGVDPITGLRNFRQQVAEAVRKLDEQLPEDQITDRETLAARVMHSLRLEVADREARQELLKLGVDPDDPDGTQPA